MVDDTNEGVTALVEGKLDFDSEPTVKPLPVHLQVRGKPWARVCGQSGGYDRDYTVGITCPGCLEIIAERKARRASRRSR